MPSYIGSIDFLELNAAGLAVAVDAVRHHRHLAEQRQLKQGQVRTGRNALTIVVSYPMLLFFQTYRIQITYLIVWQETVWLVHQKVSSDELFETPVLALQWIETTVKYFLSRTLGKQHPGNCHLKTFRLQNVSVQNVSPTKCIGLPWHSARHLSLPSRSARPLGK